MKTTAAILGLVGAMVSSAWAESYEFFTDKKIYKTGEKIKFRFKNNSSTKVWPATGVPSIYNVAGGLMYSRVTNPVFFDAVAPGQMSYWWVWEQAKFDGQQVPPGQYTAKTPFKKGSSVQTVEVSFIIEAASEEEGLVLAVEQPVYKAGVPGAVTFKATNNLNQTLKHTCVWKILRGKTVIREMNAKCWDDLPAFTSFTYVPWDKKDKNNQYVKPGSYTIEASFTAGSKVHKRSQTVALTPSGALAGGSFFPLSVGNEWVYRNGSKKFTTKVTGSTIQGGQGWYKITDLAGKDRSVIMTEKSQPTLRALSVNKKIGDLFRFKRKTGHTYDVNFEPLLLDWFMEIGSTNATVDTPAGRFKGCYRIDVPVSIEGPDPAYVSFGSFWFAPGIGLVQYTIFFDMDLQYYSLHHATIRGIDGKAYAIGLQ